MITFLTIGTIALSSAIVLDENSSAVMLASLIGLQAWVLRKVTIIDKKVAVMMARCEMCKENEKEKCVE